MLILHTPNRMSHSTHYRMCDNISKYISKTFNMDYICKKHDGESITLKCGKVVPFFRHCILENSITKKIIFIHYGDSTGYGTIVDYVKTNTDTVSCVIKFQYGKNEKYDIIKTFPCSYPPFNYDGLISFISNTKKAEYCEKNEKIFFSGMPSSNIRKDFIRNTNKLSSLWNVPNKRLEYNKYLSELICNKYALALHGGGPNCHREIECFGVGTVVISPEFNSIYSNPLIPDFHYLCIPFDYKKDFNTLVKECELKISGIEVNKYNSIRSNALKWFQENCIEDNYPKNIIKKEYIDYISNTFIRN